MYVCDTYEILDEDIIMHDFHSKQIRFLDLALLSDQYRSNQISIGFKRNVIR
jgi:hypothetical protein